MKGGGVKGIAYVGALEVLESFGFRFTHFVGTSAGAITAALLSVGFNSNELKQILAKTNFRDFKDGWLFFSILGIPFRKGLYKGEAFRVWLENLLREKFPEFSKSIYILFSHLNLEGRPIRRLTVFASTKRRRAYAFDSDGPAKCSERISFACRCSMAIPYFFIPETIGGEIVVDGGMQNNYPVTALLTTDPSLRESTDFLGFYLGNKTVTRTRKFLLLDLLSIWGEAGDEEAKERFIDRTIVIDPRPVKTTDFSLSPKEVAFLLAEGRASALRWLYHWADGIRPSLSEVDEAEKEAAHLRTEVIDERWSRLWPRVASVVLFLMIAIVGLTYVGYRSRNRTPETPKDTPALATDSIGEIIDSPNLEPVADNLSDLKVVDIKILDGERFPKLDVKVRNVGTKVAILKTAVFRVDRIWTLYNSGAALALPESWNYSVMLPVKKTPYVIRQDISQEVPANSGDRFSFTLGNDRKGPSVMGDYELFIFQMKMQLVYDEDNKVVTTNSILFLSSPPIRIQGFTRFEEQFGFDEKGNRFSYLEHNEQVAKEVKATKGIRNNSLTKLCEEVLRTRESSDKEHLESLNYALNKGLIENNLKAVEAALKAGADPNFDPDNEGFTPLLRALAKKNVEMAKVILKENPDVNIQFKNSGESALMLAAAEDLEEIVKELLSRGANKYLKAHAGDHSGKTAYEIALGRGNPRIASLLK
jgi:predicted acylesterase/phospholipase RssA